MLSEVKPDLASQIQQLLTLAAGSFSIIFTELLMFLGKVIQIVQHCVAYCTNHSTEFCHTNSCCHIIDAHDVPHILNILRAALLSKVIKVHLLEDVSEKCHIYKNISYILKNCQTLR
jgi:hypothetical protein